MHLPTFKILLLLLFSFATCNYVEAGKNSKLHFIENRGQWNDLVRYKAECSFGTVFLQNDCFTYLTYDRSKTRCNHEEHQCKIPNLSDSIQAHAVRIRFHGCNSQTRLNGSDKQQAYYNYFIGNDKSNWASNVSAFNEVHYSDLYPGIGLRVYSQSEFFKYDFRIDKGISPEQIKLQIEGAGEISVHPNKIILFTSCLQLEENIPLAYQIYGTDTIRVRCEYKLCDRFITFHFPESYNKALPLVIDPVVIASTYSGTAGVSNYGHCATYDDDGNIYTGGRCYGTGFPVTPGSLQLNFGGGTADISISKFNPDGSNLIWATYLGGTGFDVVQSMIVGFQGELFLFGTTSSTNFPVSTNAFQTGFAGQYDIFVTHLSENGDAIIGSTYIGGFGEDGLNSFVANYGDSYRGEIIIDEANNPVIVSCSKSNNFPVSANAYSTSHSGNHDAVIFKINPELSTLIFSTYLGSSNDDIGLGIRINTNGNLVFCGNTSSPDFPSTINSFNPLYLGGSSDGFICILDSNASQLLASGFIGTSEMDGAYLIDLDANDDIYIYGQNGDSLGISPGCYGNQNSRNYIKKLTKDLGSTIFTTLIGNGPSGKISPTAFMVDKCNRIYGSGWGLTTGFPVSNNALNNITDGNDFYLFVLEENSSALHYATYLGSLNTWDHVDGGTSRFDKNGIVYQAICEGGSNFPTTPNAFATSSMNSWDLVVVKIDFETMGPRALFEILPNDTACAPFNAYFSNLSTNSNNYVWDFGDGSPSSITNSPYHTFLNPGTYEIWLKAYDSTACVTTDSISKVIIVSEIPQFSLGDDTSFCLGDSIQIGTNPLPLNNLWNTGSIESKIWVKTAGLYWLEVSINLCKNTDTIIIESLNPPTSLLVNDTNICQGDSIMIIAGNSGTSTLWSNGATATGILINSTNNLSVIIDSAGCKTYDTVSIVAIPHPVSTLQNDTSICKNDTIILIPGNHETSVVWSNGNTHDSLVATSTGTFSVIIDSAGCKTYDTITIVTIPLPVSILQNDTSICKNDTIILSAGNPGTSVFWSNGSTLDSLVVASTCTYSVVIDSAGCKTIDSISINLHIIDVSLGNDTIICTPDVVLLDAFCADCHYLWNTTDTNSRISVDSSGIYSVFVHDDYCEIADSISIEYAPILNLPETLNLCGKEELIVSADVFANSYTWSTGETDSLIHIRDTGDYILTIRYFYCENTDTVTIEGFAGLDEVKYSNVITPNNDGFNDLFKPENQAFIEYTLTIFNRWGTTIFFTDNPDQAWDGKMNGQLVSDGVYFFILHYSTPCIKSEIRHMTGSISLFSGQK